MQPRVALILAFAVGCSSGGASAPSAESGVDANAIETSPTDVGPNVPEADRPDGLETDVLEIGARDDASTDSSDADDGAAVDSETGIATDALLDDLERHLVGSYDSVPQAKADPNFLELSLEICPIEVEGHGRALYVEQAAFDRKDLPYRQRIWALEGPGSAPIARSFQLAVPARLVGHCTNAVGRLRASELTETTGCEVRWTWAPGSGSWRGSIGSTCPSTLSGASYMTSSIEVTRRELSSWDRGYDDRGRQVWGSTVGPAVFTRRSRPPSP
jgi:hypothetical protein